MEASDLLKQIDQLVEEKWAQDQTPFLLSNLPNALQKRVDEDFRAVFKEQGLKAFLKEHSDNGHFTLVQDPAHPARVGLIPINESYSFTKSLMPSNHVSDQDIAAFARVLGTMTEEEQRLVSFPASFIARIFS